MKLSSPAFNIIALLLLVAPMTVMARLGEKTSPVGGRELEEKRKLATSRYLKAQDDNVKISDEYTIEFVDGKEVEGRALIDGLLKKHQQSKKLADMTNAVQAVTIVGVPAADMMDFLVDNLNTLAMVEEDTLVQAASLPPPASWGLDRIDQESLPLDSSYYPANNLDGSNVDIYILDTGVDTTHSEFRGRIVNGADFTGEANMLGKDPSGHGTHVAGIAAGTTSGVAKRANIIPVRVLKANGIGAVSWSIQGIDWAVQQAAKTGRKSIINISLGGSISSIENNAIKNAVKAGIVVVVSAGNDLSDACNYGPANAPEAITVASSTKMDGRSTFSNYGSCVNIFAPGTDILSAKPGGGSKVDAGTSMAAPHVAGAAALIFQKNPKYTALKVKQELMKDASDGKISDLKGSPNKLLHVPSRYNKVSRSEWSSYVNDWDATFMANNGNDAICGMSSIHNNVYEDRKFRFKYCKPVGTSTGVTSTGSSAYTSFERIFSYNCPSGSHLSQIESSHNTQSKDRAFRFTCSRFDSFSLGDCKTTGWVNNYGAQFDYDAKGAFFITGVESSHSNIHEDRRYKFKVCAVLAHVPSKYATLSRSDWSSYINGWDATFVAKNGGDAICGISSVHNNMYEDRLFRFKYCKPVGTSTGVTSTGSSAYTNFDQTFSYNCPSGSHLSQIESIHNNQREDRAFRFTCSRFDGFSLGDCKTTGWVNNYGAQFDYDAKGAFVITGVESAHSNIHEDRIYKFKVCAVLAP